jgi:hypothetical protein
MVLRAVCLSMGRTAASCASRMSLFTATLVGDKVNVLRHNPKTALRLMTVDSLAYRNASLSRNFLKCFAHPFRHVPKDSPKGDRIQAALWRPLLLVLCAGSHKSDKAVRAIVVTWYFYHVPSREVIQARHTFTRTCLATALSDTQRRDTALTLKVWDRDP